MASSRDSLQTKKEEILNCENFIMEATKNPTPFCPPPNLPKFSMGINQFTFLKKEEEDKEGRQTYHVVNTAKKNDKDYFIKYNKPDSPVSELEVTCWMWYKIIARELVPKTTFICHNEKFQFIGVASEKIPGFTSNHADPLQDTDFKIEAVEHDFPYQRNRLLEILNQLSKCLNRPIYGESMFTSIWNCAKYSYNVFCSSSPTAAQVQWYCNQFLSPQADFSRSKLIELMKILDGRQKHINTLPASDQYRLERNLLEKGFEYVNLLVGLKESDLVNIQKLEAIDEMAPNDEELKKLPCHELLSFNYGDEKIEISIKDIENYRLIKGIARGSVTSYVNAENDYHSKNGSKKGLRIDFDMSEWDFMSNFKQCNCFEWLFNGLINNRFIELISWNKSPSDDPFVFTERDIRSFPCLQDASFRYWPTKSDILSKSSQNIASHIFENLYTSENSENFKKLQIHPVFIYHKYRTFLKIILINENMIRESAALVMRNDLTMPNSSKKILDEFIQYKLTRLQKLKTLLLKMPEFREFIVKNKNHLFQSIKKEFEKDIFEYKQEMKEYQHEHYRKLIRAINIDEMEKEFQSILEISETKIDVHTANWQAGLG